MGAEPMSNIQKFRDTIKDMGIDDVLTVQQAAYERFKAGKAFSSFKRQKRPPSCA